MLIFCAAGYASGAWRFACAAEDGVLVAVVPEVRWPLLDYFRIRYAMTRQDMTIVNMQVYVYLVLMRSETQKTHNTYYLGARRPTSDASLMRAAPVSLLR
jgi:hypothetical protein